MKEMLRRMYKDRAFWVTGVGLLVIGIGGWILLSGPFVEPWWSMLKRESRRILGREVVEISSEEKQIREEIILKKMEEASSQRDWRDLAPEYPRLKNTEPVDEKERMKVFRGSPQFREIEEELKTFVRKREDQFNPELPVPPLKDATALGSLKDKAAERIAGRLVSKKEKMAAESPLEENLHLGIKGPLASRKILEKPPLPRVKVNVEAEIELTLWVLPNGAVDRVIPSVKGDAELERIAIAYLKQWRFESLPREGPQVEQWGTIPVKFKLQQ
jgi:TonB family protein